jgi:protein SEY1
MNEGFAPYLKSINFADDSKDYSVVSVIGPQSTGKSTLMNILFDTDFKTAERVGPQTTRGIWVGRDANRKILVFDVEGSDSLE